MHYSKLLEFHPRPDGTHGFPLKDWLHTWLAVALIAALSLILQLITYPNHDVAWILWGARAMLNGAAWGRDIIEPNPPLAWYLAAPSTWLADRLGLPVAAAFRVAVAASAFFSLTVFQRLLAAADHSPSTSLRAETFVAALFLFLLPHREFAQREHLMLIAVLPYLGLVALRCTQKEPVPTAPALLVGVAAGIGFALKPHFLAVPALVELTAWLIARRRGWLIRPETLGIGATIGLYGMAVLLFARDYVDDVVPLVHSIYWSFDRPLSFVIQPMALPMLFAGGVMVTLRRLPSKLPPVLMAATAGFAVSYLLQQKGYPYHLLPVTAGATLTIASALESVRRSVRTRVLLASMIALLLIQPSLRAVQWWQDNRSGGRKEVAIARMIQAIDRETGGGRFLAVAVHPFPAFPTALYVEAEQVSRTNSQWFLPAVAQLRSGRPERKAGDLARAEKNAIEFMLRDLAQRPDVVIIDTNSRRHTNGPRGFDFLAFYKEDAQFRAAWQRYREVDRVGEYRLFVGRQGVDR